MVLMRFMLFRVNQARGTVLFLMDGKGLSLPWVMK